MDLSKPLFWIVLWAGVAVVWWWQDARAKAKERAQRARELAEREQQEKDEADFLKRAKPMRARIRSSLQGGRVNLMPNFEFHLTIEAPEGPYDVWVTKPLDYMEIPLYVVGTLVDIRVDPNNRERVVLGGPAIADELPDARKR